MEFDNNRPIYIQIADNISNRILSGELKPGSRIPSVREWGAGIESTRTPWRGPTTCCQTAESSITREA